MLLGATGCKPTLQVNSTQLTIGVGQAEKIQVMDEDAYATVASRPTDIVAKAEKTTTRNVFVVMGLSAGRSMIYLEAEGFNPRSVDVLVTSP